MLCALARQGRCSLGLLVQLDRIPAVALELADIDSVFEVNASRCRQRFFNSWFAPHSRFSKNCCKPPRASRKGEIKTSTLRTPLRNATPALPALYAGVRTLWVMRNVGAHYLMWWGMLLGTLLEALFPPTNSRSIRQRYQLSFLPARRSGNERNG